MALQRRSPPARAGLPQVSEFARVARGDFSPADCLRCGRTEDLLDLGGGDKQGYGRIYLCTVCFGELCDNMEYVAPEVLTAQATVMRGRIQAEADRRVEVERQ